MKNLNSGDFLDFFQMKENWLLSLFAAFYFLFPTVLPLAQVALLLIILMGLFRFRNGSYWTIYKNTPVLWALGALYAVILIGCLFTPASSDWIFLHLGKYAKFIYAIVLVLLLTDQDKWQRVAFNAFVAAMLFILISTWLSVNCL